VVQDNNFFTPSTPFGVFQASFVNYGRTYVARELFIGQSLNVAGASNFFSVATFNYDVSFNDNVWFTQSITTNGINNTGLISSGTLNVSSDVTMGGGDLTLNFGSIYADSGTVSSSSISSTSSDITSMIGETLTLGTGGITIPVAGTPYGTLTVVLYCPAKSYFAGISYFNTDVEINGYLKPTFPLARTSLRMGSNAMLYQTADASNCIVFGTNALQGTTNPAYYNGMGSSIVIGHNAVQSSTRGQDTINSCFNNTIIGINACRHHFYQVTDLVVIGGNCLSAGLISGSRNSVVLGANIGSLPSASAGFDAAVVIGSNVLKRSGCNSGVIIGPNAYGNSTFDYSNGACVVGYNSGLNAIANNRMTVFGNDSMKNWNSNAFGMVIGPEAGNSMVTNLYCMCFGAFADCGNNLKNATAFGVNCVVSQSNTMRFGGKDGGFTGLGYDRFQDFLIASKNRLLCGAFYTGVATVTLTFELAEHIYIQSSTTTTINLPTPQSATTGSINLNNIGARFTLLRTYAGTYVPITINAPSGQTIVYDNTASATYTWETNENYVTFVCVNTTGSTWSIINSQKITNVMNLTSAQNVSGIKSFLTLNCGMRNPIFFPRLFTRGDSVGSDVHAIGSLALNNIQVDATNTSVSAWGQSTLAAKTINTLSTIAWGQSSMSSFTSESFFNVSSFGQSNLTLDTGFSMSGVNIMANNTTFTTAGGIKPTSVTNALFLNTTATAEIALPAAAAVSNVFAIRTAQPITKSNQGIIGDSTEITLHSTGQKTIVTGSFQCQQTYIQTISPSSIIHEIAASKILTTPFYNLYYAYFSGGMIVNLPRVTVDMIGQQFTIRRMGGSLALSAMTIQTEETTAASGFWQPVLSSLNQIGAVPTSASSPVNFMGATQSSITVMCAQTNWAQPMDATGRCSYMSSSTTLTVTGWPAPSSSAPYTPNYITIGSLVRTDGNAIIRQVIAFGTGIGATGTYTMSGPFSTTSNASNLQLEIFAGYGYVVTTAC
jgi:hypothetical protein